MVNLHHLSARVSLELLFNQVVGADSRHASKEKGDVWKMSTKVKHKTAFRRIQAVLYIVDREFA